MNRSPGKRRDDASWLTQPTHIEQYARDLVPEGLRMLHDVVTVRARESGAQALLLTGSTARGSLRFGCVVFDEGIVRESVRLIGEQGLWPDPVRKQQQARKSIGIARAMVASGDHDAAVEQVRTALTLTARWRLLVDQRFPLARAELPAQLEELGYMTLAARLAAAIHGAPSLRQLALSVEAAYGLLDTAPAKAQRTAQSHAA